MAAVSASRTGASSQPAFGPLNRPPSESRPHLETAPGAHCDNSEPPPSLYTIKTNRAAKTMIKALRAAAKIAPIDLVSMERKMVG